MNAWQKLNLFYKEANNWRYSPNQIPNTFIAIPMEVVNRLAKMGLPTWVVNIDGKLEGIFNAEWEQVTLRPGIGFTDSNYVTKVHLAFYL